MLTKDAMTRERWIGIIYILIAVGCYSFFSVFTKSLLAEGMTPIDIGVWRFIFSVSMLWAIWLVKTRRSGPRRLPKVPLWAVIVMGALTAVAAFSAFFGLERIPAATFLVLYYSYPMLSALLEAALGRRLPGTAWVALVLTLIGVAVAAPDFSGGLQGDNAVGVLLALTDATVVAVYFVIMSRALQHTEDKGGATAMIFTVTLIIMLVVGVLLGASAPPTPRAWLLVITMAFFSTTLPNLALSQGVPRLGSAEAGVIASIEPITASLLAWAFLGEVMTGQHWAGGLIIIGGIVVLQLPVLRAHWQASRQPSV